MKPAFLYFFALAFLFAGPTVHAQQWEPTNGPFGGGYAIYQNDTYVFAATPNGIYRTADTGLNWHKASVGLPEFHIASIISLHDSSLIAALSVRFDYSSIPPLYISHDNAETWTLIPYNGSDLSYQDIAYDGQTVTILTYVDNICTLLQTHDDGQTWNTLNTPGNICSHKLLSGIESDIFLLNQNGMYLSLDKGVTWNSIPMPDIDPLRISQVQVIDSSIVLVPDYSEAKPAYVSHDYGSSWSVLNTPWHPYGISKIFSDGDDWYMTRAGDLYKYNIATQNWSAIHDFLSTQQSLSGIEIRDGAFMSVNLNTQWPNLYRSTDLGQTFQFTTNGINASMVFAIQPKDGDLYVGTQHHGLQKTAVGNWDWANAEHLYDSLKQVTNFWVDDDKTLVVSNGRLYITTNGGQSWTDILPSQFNNNPNLGWYPTVKLECKGDTIYFDRFRSTDFGSSWVNLAQNLIPTSFNSASNFTLMDTSMFLFIGYGGMYRSDDEGVTWVQKNNGFPSPNSGGYLYGGAIYSTENMLFAPVYGTDDAGGLFRSLDNGETWELAGSGLFGCLTCNYSYQDGKFLKIGDKLLVTWGGQNYISPDEGLHWIPYPTVDRTYCLATDGSQLYAGTDGFGIFVGPLPGNINYHVFKGIVYEDLNDNGVKEPEEPLLPYYNVELKNTPQSAFTDSLGYFEFYAQFTSDTATVSKPSTSIYTNPPFHVFSETDSIYMFGVRPNRYAEGFVYNDANNNGIRDAGEQGLQGIEIGVDNGYVVNVTDANGHYFSSLSPAFDTIRAVAPNPFAIVHPEYLPLNIQDSIYNFGIYLSPDYPDLSLILNASNVPGPGFTEIYYLTVKNLGAETGANLVFNFDPALVYLSTDYAPTAVNGNQIQWQLPSLQPLETFQISVYLQVPTTVPINSILNHNASVESQIATDAFLPNNVDSLTETVRGSFDPNDKQVWPEGDFTSLQIAGSEALNYKIRFQNTGNFPAEKVVILDTLATGLDPATLRIEAASHAYEWNILDGHIVEFIFDMINLPDSTSNEADSHGFVEYSILCKNSMRLGGIIDNTAYIYFDFNEPVATNTTNTAVVRSSKVQTQTAAVCVGELYEGLPIFADTVFTEIVSYPYFDSVYLTMVAALPVYDLSVDTAVQIGTSFLGHPIGQDTTIMLNLLTVDGCDSTMTYHVSVWTALNGVEKGKYQIKVFPTIISDLINIQSPTPIAAAIKVNLYGPLGQKMNTWVLKSGVSRWQLDGLNLPPGLYFLSINIGEASHVFKLVRQ